MNYDELIKFADDALGTYQLNEFVQPHINRAIEYQSNGAIGIAIHNFANAAHSYDHIAVFARELIDYIDGLNANQDNGEPT